MKTTVKRIPGYMSYQDCTTFLAYLKTFGADGLVEAHGGTDQSAPMNERIGAVVRSVKELHASRYAGTVSGGNMYEQKLAQIKVEFSETDAPTVPEESTWACVFYLQDQATSDMYGEKEISPKCGDIVIFSTKEQYAPGKLSEEVCPKLYSFWKAI
tara:strand:- start:2983 stop:3450 length:468 start_codon:yes stop_codon:yes gene_type:complete